MKKIDFTVKETKLPQIPTKTRFSTISTILEVNQKQPFSLTVSIIDNLVSYGVIEIDNVVCIKADKSGYAGENYLVLRLSDIERLAEEQGIYKEEDERKPIGYKLKPECEKYRKAANKIVFPCSSLQLGGQEHCDCYIDSEAPKILIEAGVLHWFDEVYEETTKDYVGKHFECCDKDAVVFVVEVLQNDNYKVVVTNLAKDYVKVFEITKKELLLLLNREISEEDYDNRTEKLHREIIDSIKF